MTIEQTLIGLFLGCFAVMCVVMSAVLRLVSDPTGSLGDKLTYRKYVPPTGDGGAPWHDDASDVGAGGD